MAAQHRVFGVPPLCTAAKSSGAQTESAAELSIADDAFGASPHSRFRFGEQEDEARSPDGRCPANKRPGQRLMLPG